MASRFGGSLLRARQTPGLRTAARVGLWMMGVEIPASVVVGDGLKLNHPRQGIVIHPDVVIGDRVVIFQRVTIGHSRAGQQLGRGGRAVGDDGRPPTGRADPDRRPIVVIEDDVLIGAGAIVLGSEDSPTVLGRGTLVGANAVVTRSTEAGSVYAATSQRLR
jgi:serine O-acetyltransferase